MYEASLGRSLSGAHETTKSCICCLCVGFLRIWADTSSQTIRRRATARPGRRTGNALMKRLTILPEDSHRWQGRTAWRTGDGLRHYKRDATSTVVAFLALAAESGPELRSRRARWRCTRRV